MAELRVDEVAVRFGGLQALHDVDLTVRGGQVHGLIGPNGAGKTTLFNVVTGLQAPTRGRVRLDGRDVTRLRPHRRARLGIARTFQRLEVCGTLTARENVQLAVEARRHRRLAGRTSAQVADELLERVGIASVADEPSDALPTGLARLVELARALATQPAVLLVDEPSSGLDHGETAALGRILSDLAADGMAVLLVEHDMGLVLQVSHELTVLDYGEVIARGDPVSVRDDPAVQTAYLGEGEGREGGGEVGAGEGEGGAGGGEVGEGGGGAGEGAAADGAGEARAGEAAGPGAAAGGGGEAAGPGAPAGGGAPAGSVRAAPGRPSGRGTSVAQSPAAGSANGSPAGAPTAPALVLADVRAAYGRIEVVHGVSLEVAPGSVCALLGPNGAGKSTLLKVVSGRLAPTAGTVRVQGHEARRPAPERLARSGVCSIPEGRAIFPNLTVAENLRMCTYRGHGVKLSELEDQTFTRFPRLADRRRQLAGTLSGGEQQMLALARALYTNPSVLLLDEISMGLAPLIVAELYRLVGELVRAERLTVLLVEQFAKTALELADHAAIMVNGEIVRAGAPKELEPTLVQTYMGGAPV